MAETTTAAPAPADNVPVESTPAPAATPAPATPEPVAETPAVNFDALNVPESVGKLGDSFKTLVGDMKLSQENTQALIDYYNKEIVGPETAAMQKTVEGWRNDSMSKFGQEGIEVAKKAYNTFATPELKELFESTGLANNPAVIALFNNIGKQITEGHLTLGGGNPKPKTAGELLFTKSLQR